MKPDSKKREYKIETIQQVRVSVLEAQREAATRFLTRQGITPTYARVSIVLREWAFEGLHTNAKVHGGRLPPP